MTSIWELIKLVGNVYSFYVVCVWIMWQFNIVTLDNVTKKVRRE